MFRGYFLMRLWRGINLGNMCDISDYGFIAIVNFNDESYCSATIMFTECKYIEPWMRDIFNRFAKIAKIKK